MARCLQQRVDQLCRRKTTGYGIKIKSMVHRFYSRTPMRSTPYFLRPYGCVEIFIILAVAPISVPPPRDELLSSLVASHRVHWWVVLLVVIQRINADAGLWVASLGNLAVTNVYSDVVDA